MDFLKGLAEATAEEHPITLMQRALELVNARREPGQMFQRGRSSTSQSSTAFDR